MIYQDGISNNLADLIGSDPNNNTVGSVYSNVYANPDKDTPWGDRLLKAVKQTVQPNKYADTATGTAFYNSPPMIAQRYNELGKFFKGAEPGNEYTNHFIPPAKQQTPQSVSPNDFYNQWYEKMRQFAEAEQVANRGQIQTRTR